MMPNRPVSAVMNRRFFLAVPHDQSVQEAAALMKRHKLDAALVLDGRSLIGICTERDMVFDVLAEGLDPKQIPISAIMTKDPVTVRPQMTFGNALHLMYEGSFRHLPVVGNDGQVFGLVSARDALELDIIRCEKELIVRQELSEIL